MPDLDKERREDLRETVKMLNEFFKHLTTLSIAMAIVLLALYREGLVNPNVDPLAVTVSLVGSLLCLSISLVFALGGMTRMTTILTTPEEPNRMKIPERIERMQRLSLTAGGFFFAGLATFFVTVGLRL